MKRVSLTIAREADLKKVDTVKIKISFALFLEKGFFLSVPEEEKGFWLYLGAPIGWGRWEKLSNRMETADPTLFELVEVLPACSPAPSPLASVPGVLWSRQEAIEAEISIQRYIADMAQREKGD